MIFRTFPANNSSGGFVADRVGGLNLLYPMTTLSGVLCLTLWLLADNVGLVVAFACLYGMSLSPCPSHYNKLTRCPAGFCSGIFISVMPSVVASISPGDKIGARLGAFSVWGAIGVFTGTPIGGAFIQDGTESEYARLIGYAGACMTAAGLTLFAARVVCDKNLRSKW